MATDWSLFFGRFHPLIIHLPIGIILFAALLNVVAAYKKNTLLTSAVNIALLTGAITACLAAVSGYFLSTAGGYNKETIFWHKWIGITAATLAFLVWLLRINPKADPRILKTAFSNWLLCACIFLVILGGHLGGNMTHGEGYLSRYMPDFLKSVFATKTKPPGKKITLQLDSVIVFADIIQPIFNARCVSCHNTEKGKGELDLTNLEGMMKGGKSGNTIVPGDVGKSELVHRITLSQQSSKFMPSDGRSPLTPIELNFIKSWIETGADDKKNITASGTDEKTRFLIASYLGIDTENDKEIKLPEVTPADSVVLRQLREMKIILRPLTSKSNLLEASFVMVPRGTPAQLLALLEKLTPLRQQLYRLNISDHTLTREAIQVIAAFSRLHKLEIQKSDLTDESIEPLSALQQLVILNAGQNMLTDKCIPAFKKLAALKKINLWKTQVTEEGARDLQSQLKGLVTER